MSMCRPIRMLLAILACTVSAAVVVSLAVAAVFVAFVRAGRGEFRPQHPGFIRFAICQYDSRIGDPDWNFDHAMAYAEEAVRHGADVVVLPEFSFSTVHDVRSKRSWFNLEEVPRLTNTLCSFTRRHHAFLFVNHGRTFGDRRQHHLNETTLFGPDGAEWTRYDKCFMALIDQRVNYGPGDGPVVAELPFARIGMLICKDTSMPDAYADAYADADLLLAQFGYITHWGDRWVPRGLRDLPAKAALAFDEIAGLWTGLFRKPMLMANKTGLEDDFAFLGGSRVVAADGRTVALANSDACVLYVDFPLKDDGRIDPSSPTVPENPTDKIEGGHARKFRTFLKHVAAWIP